MWRIWRMWRRSVPADQTVALCLLSTSRSSCDSLFELFEKIIPLTSLPTIRSDGSKYSNWLVTTEICRNQFDNLCTYKSLSSILDVRIHLTVNYFYLMRTKRVFNPKFWSHGRTGYVGNNLYFCLVLSEDLQQAISHSRLTKYVIVFTPRWLKVPIVEMRSISERWL